MLDTTTLPANLKERLEQATITGLYYYPIKSCGGQQVEQAEVGERGIKHDREFMLVEADTNQFITQREKARMALISPQVGQGYLQLEAPDMPLLKVAIAEEGPRRRTKVWQDSCETVDQGDEVAGWLSEFLKTECRLVRMAPDFTRKVKRQHAKTGEEQVAFADAYPFLLASDESLADLNSRLDEPLLMNRFRPNVVIGGSGVPFGEDLVQQISLGGITFRVVKPCARCAVTTTDQATARRGKEPLRTLATYRRDEDGEVMFAQNMIHENTGVLRLGDRLKVIELKAQPPDFR